MDCTQRVHKLLFSKQLAFVATVFLLSGAFFALQWEYIHTLPLVMDEFVSARNAYRLTSDLPYEDFRPYKTVLAHYVHALILSCSSDHWSGLMAVKTYLVALNCIMVMVGAFVLRRHVRSSAVIASLVLLLSVSTFVERAAELRVDMTTTWAGFASLLFLLNKRAGWAGLFAGISFLVSQKGIYYVTAGELALGSYWLFSQRTRHRFHDLLQYNAFLGFSLAAYFGFWGFYTSFSDVLAATFLAPLDSHIVFGNPYSFDIRERFLKQSIWRNPFYYALTAIGLWRLEWHRRRQPDNYGLWIAFVYSSVTIALCLTHKHAWPYFLVLMFPLMFVVHAFLFDLDYIDTDDKRTTVAGMTPLLLTVFIGLGVLYPLSRVDDVLARSQKRQRHTVEIAEAFLGEDETYLAGVPMLYKHAQVHPYFKSVDVGQQKRLRGLPKKRVQELLELIKSAKMPFTIQSERMARLPAPIRTYIGQNYRRFRGNVFGYAQKLSTKANSFELRLKGRYRIERKGPPVRIDGSRVQRGDFLYLEEGRHRIEPAEGVGETQVLLRLYPPIFDDAFPEEFKRDGSLFPEVYSY